MTKSETSSAQPSQDHIKLFIPGPSEVKREILAAQSQWMVGHRMPECADLIGRVKSKLNEVFKTSGRVLISSSSGTGLQEAAVRNCSGLKVLNCVNGAFSQRWAKVTESNGKANSVLEVAWGQPIRPNQVIEELSKDDYDAVTIVHNETSTGVISPIKEIAKAIREAFGQEVMILVDSVSGLGGAQLDFDKWDLDVDLTSSQKAFALPPGLAFCAVSDRALERAATVLNRGYYFDFLSLEKYLRRNQTPATPAISLLYALDLQLDYMLAEGIDSRVHRHEKLREQTMEWAKARGFSHFAAEGFESPTVTCLNNDLEIDVGELNSFLRTRGYIISNGYGPLKDRTLRIAHMGETTSSDLAELFDAMDTYLVKTNNLRANF